MVFSIFIVFLISLIVFSLVTIKLNGANMNVLKFKDIIAGFIAGFITFGIILFIENKIN